MSRRLNPNKRKTKQNPIRLDKESHHKPCPVRNPLAPAKAGSLSNLDRPPPLRPGYKTRPSALLRSSVLSAFRWPAPSSLSRRLRNCFPFLLSCLPRLIRLDRTALSRFDFYASSSPMPPADSSAHLESSATAVANSARDRIRSTCLVRDLCSAFPTAYL